MKTFGELCPFFHALAKYKPKNLNKYILRLALFLWLLSYWLVNPHSSILDPTVGFLQNDPVFYFISNPFNSKILCQSQMEIKSCCNSF